jgi:hypothetical protein
LNGKLRRQGLELEALELESAGKDRQYFEIIFAFGLEFGDEFGGCELVEEVINERHESDGEDRLVLVLLLLKVGQDGLVLDVDGSHLLPLAYYPFQLVYLYFSLLHAFHYNQW